MNYPIPDNIEDILALQKKPANEEIIVAAIAGVVKIARNEGQSLDELTAEILQDDQLLDSVQRLWLSKITSQVWQSLS